MILLCYLYCTQGVTGLHSSDGSDSIQSVGKIDFKELKRKRKKIECDVCSKRTGARSGLGKTIIDA